MLTDKKIITYAKARSLRTRLSNKTIVLTAGCFDILHIGHAMHLSYCKSKGDILVVSIGNDENIKSLKGVTRPINSQTFRARLLASMSTVDYVIISEENGLNDHDNLFVMLKPNVYITYSSDPKVNHKKEIVNSYGGQVILCRRLPPNHLKGGISTTLLAEKIKNVK